MKTLHFKSLIKSFVAGFILGIVYTLICVLAGTDVFAKDAAIHLIIGSVLAFFISLGINLVVWPVITLLDREAMNEKTFMELVHRYLPLFSLPFMCVLIFFICFPELPAAAEIHVFAVMLTAYTNFYLYLNFLKYSSPDHVQTPVAE